MRAVALGACAFLAAYLLAPDPPIPGEAFPAPPPEGVARALALGRIDAAADLLWLRCVQMVGHPDAEPARYPHVDEWIDLVTLFAPDFEYPYAFAAVLLATEEDARLNRIDTILARGEAYQPANYWFPLHRGFLAYFGMLDSQVAAVHYERASTKEGAPKYLRSFVKRLQNEETACANMPAQLGMVASSQSARDAQALREKALSIIQHCVQAEWRRSRGKFNLLNLSGHDEIENFVNAGLVKPLPVLPGLCWRLNPTVLPELHPCGDKR